MNADYCGFGDWPDCEGLQLPTLATTGIDPLMAVVIAAVAVGLGAVVLLIGRKRRTRNTDTEGTSS